LKAELKKAKRAVSEYRLSTPEVGMLTTKATGLTVEAHQDASPEKTEHFQDIAKAVSELACQMKEWMEIKPVDAKKATRANNFVDRRSKSRDMGRNKQSSSLSPDSKLRSQG